MSWLKLIRWQNLVIIFLTQLLAWMCVIYPMTTYSAVPLSLHATEFFHLAISTVLIAAAGYVINDYFDIKIDSINRPDKVVLERAISLKTAIILHTALNVAGLAFAFIVARHAGHYSFLILQMSCTILLWLYSTRFKQRFMIGNVVVALLTAFTMAVLMLYENGIHYYIDKPFFLHTEIGIIPNPVWVLGVYAYFAFMLTWMREIVKDMEDFKGDAEEGCMTMPIKWGLLRSVQFTQVLGVLTILPLIVGSIKLWIAGWVVLSVYTLLALTLPICTWIFYLRAKADTLHYHKASRWLKIIMVSGIGSLIIYYFQAHA